MSPKLRALGRLLLFAALVFVVFPAKRRWLRGMLHGVDGTAVYVLDHRIDLVAVLLFGWIMAAIERRSFATFGLPWRLALRARFWQGAVAGLASLTVLVLVLRATGAIQLGLPSTVAVKSLAFGLTYAILFLLLAVREEFMYRG